MGSKGRRRRSRADLLTQNLLERHTHALAMDQIVQFVEPLKQFSKDSVRLVKRCTKPDRKNSRRLPLLRRLDLPSWASLVSSSSLSTSPSTTLLSGHKDGSLPQRGGGPSHAAPFLGPPLPLLIPPSHYCINFIMLEFCTFMKKK